MAPDAAAHSAARPVQLAEPAPPAGASATAGGGRELGHASHRSLSAARRAGVDERADAFEAALAAGRRPSIERALAGAPAAMRRELCEELVGLEADARRRRGGMVDGGDYAGRFSGALGVGLAAADAARWAATQGFAPDPACPGAAAPAPPFGPPEPPALPRPLAIDRTRGEGGLLGRGGIGSVWAARDGATGRAVAVKTLHPHFAADPELADRFAREARLSRGFRRRREPGVPLFEAFRPGDRRRPALLVTELAGGPTFRDLFADFAAANAGPARAAARQRGLTLLRAAAKVLARAHRRGVIHRDLKPANLMLAGPYPLAAGPAGPAGRLGRVVLIDWGLGRDDPPGRPPDEPAPPAFPPAAETETVSSFPIPPAGGDDTVRVAPPAAAAAPPAFARAETRRHARRDTARDAVLGSAPYMAPEQALMRDTGPRTDVYSFGLMLLELLTGAAARPGETAEALLDAARRGHVGEALHRLEHCDAGARLVGLCARCVRPDPAGRPAHAAAVLADLDRLSARDPRTGRRVWRLTD